MVTNWETHIAMCFIILFLKICGSCDIWNFVTTGYIPRGEGHFDVCVCIQIHHGQILIVISENVGKHFLQCLRNCKPFAQHAVASSTAGEGEGGSKLLRAGKNNQIKQWKCILLRQ